MHTPTPWDWLIHDHSMASLGVMPDPGMGDPLVLSVSPCKACADRAEPQEWEWGRCCTPSADDAAFIVKAVNSHDKLVDALRRLVDAAEAVAWNANVGTADEAIKMAEAALEGLE